MTSVTALGRRAGLFSAKSFRFADLIALRRQRKALARLDDAALRDMGLSRQDAALEAKRPAWDVPSTWRC
nr:DUF1127 domain-containing protein [uncultured Shimia sp.]